ncbi:MAG: ATP-binding cassette domain-containing protein [Bacteroidales bacterium]|nr:ATP-binding cassette domain-containing protein [Bacteroidales bacterium]HPD94918.1 ATP-binding cassette domain-containing protein [Tenuifilaceae bacterium]HRX31343.1 ATP-binding cassette domain-containing protein [Tenuifilaceae bacterium]
MDENTLIDIKKANIFQEDSLILTDVNLSVQKGEFLYIIGRVGSGKTSLIKTITAELPLSQGDATICGFNLRKVKRRQVPKLRRKIGIVFQDFQLLTDRSVYENLQFVLRSTGWKNKNEIKQRISDVLDLVGLKFKDYKMPHQLSGGEQQRVVIARALLNNPDVILADEPTGNLDIETSEGIMDVLHNIVVSGKAVIMATHNINLIKKYPARTLKCEKGKVLETEHTAAIDFESLMD